MADQPPSTDPTSGSICPWCSAPLSSVASVCPSCGANLTADEEPVLPGVTAIDPEAARGARKPAGRNRLLSWINGEYDAEAAGPPVEETGALAPPDADVQREILRLEIEAEVANLQAEAGARYAEAVADGRVGDLPEGIEALATGSPLSEVLAGSEPPADDGADTPGEDAPRA
jgi:hypothetical protein